MSIKKWHLKAVVQKTISYLPFSNRVNFVFQKYVTKGVDLNDTYFSYKLEHAADHISFYQEHATAESLQGTTCLELGTGWYPIVPLCLYLAGAEQVHSVDISPLLTHTSVHTAIQKVLEKASAIRAVIPDTLPERWNELSRLVSIPAENTDLDTLCQAIGLHSHVADARQLDWSDGSFDLVTSNNTFEHIYPQILQGIITELWRITKPGGLMSHFVDLSDHFAHMDSSITIYNFLKYSEAAWAWIDNSIQPQSRLRWPQYQSLYQQLGVPYREAKIRDGNTDQVKALSLAEPYANMPIADVAISHGYFLSVK